MGTRPLHMEIDEELLQQLEELARHENCPPEQLATRAIRTLLRQHAAEREALVCALTEADEGRFISEEAMTAWFESLGTEHELPEPSPDVIVKQG